MSLTLSMAFLPFPWPFAAAYDDDNDTNAKVDHPYNADTPAPIPVSPRTPRSPLVTRLQYFSRPGIPPPSARVDPLLNQEVRKPLRIVDLWRYIYMIATKSAEITADLMSHYIWGPRKPSWGVEMTFITSFMRNANKHSQLADVTTLRKLMQIGGLVPLPSNAMITPATFRVKRRGLRGILAEFDAREDGKRDISGEWIVSRRLWHRLQSEWKRSQLDKSTPQSKQRVVLYLHGGAYFVFSAATHRLITIPLSKYVGARVFAIDYRLAPETQFPGPLHDAVSAYFRLLDDLHIPPENILIAGDSAGGGLSLALLMYLRDNDYPMPAGAILLSPWVDLTMSCDSWDSNAPFDVVPRPNPNDHLNPVACYLGASMEKYLTHPYASPLFGNFEGLPPMLVQNGDAEVLRDEITLLAHKATLSGVEVRHELYEDAVHVFQMFPFLDTARRSFLSCREFVHEVLPCHQRNSPRVIESAALDHETGNTASRLVRDDGVEVDTVLPAYQQVAADAEVGEESVMGGTDSDTTVDDVVEWVKENQDPLLPGATTPQHERDGTSVDPDMLQAVPPSPPLHATKEDSLLGHALSWASSTLPRTRASRKHFTFVLGSPSSPSSSFTALPTASMSTTTIGNSVSSDIDVAEPPSPTRRRSPATTVTPAPTIRARHRAISHPDMAELCRDWAQGPANQTRTFRPDRH